MRTFRALMALILVGAAAIVHAQSWPAKPVRLILSQPPGSSPDIVARLVSDRMTRGLGQSIVVENRPGGQNVVGAQAAARAPADGYTFFYATTAALVINPYTFKSLPYDPKTDFVPVGMLGQSPFVIAVHPDVPAKSLAELVNHAKANPDRLSMATEGTKTFGGMMADLFVASAGVKIAHVPYSGVAPGIQDTIANRTQVTVQSMAAISAHLRRDALRPLAVTSARRVAVFPNVPTFAESYPGFEYTGWHALMAPKGTPAEAITRMNRELDAAMRDPEIIKRLSDLGVIVDDGGAGPPERLAAFLDAEHARWGRLAKAINIVPE